MYGSAQTPSNPLAPFAHSALRGFVAALSLSLSQLVAINSATFDFLKFK